MELFQRAQQDFPKLIEDLGAAVVPRRIHLLRQCIQSFLQPNLLQKIIQRQHLLRQILRLAETTEQPNQRVNCHFAGFVDQLQPGCGFLIKNATESIGMVRPVILPPISPNAPTNRIVLHQIADIRFHRRQHRAQIAQDAPLLKAAQRRIHGRQHRGNHAFLQNILCAGQVHRNAAAVECQIHKTLISSKICAHDRNIPVTATAPHQFHNLLRRSQTLLIGRFRLADLQGFAAVAGENLSLEQGIPHGRKLRVPGRNPLDLYFLSCPLGNSKQLGCRISRFFKGQQLGIYFIAVHADGDTGGILDQMLQNRHVLTGKVRESIYVKYMAFRKISLRQLLQQQCFLITGVALAEGAERVIAFQNQRQLFQFLRQASVCFLSRRHQILGGNTAALKLIHSLDQACQEFRFRLHRSIGF